MLRPHAPKNGTHALGCAFALDPDGTESAIAEHTLPDNPRRLAHLVPAAAAGGDPCFIAGGVTLPAGPVRKRRCALTDNLARPVFPDTSRPEAPAPTLSVVDEFFPLLRGWLHLICFFVSIPAGLIVVASAASGRARLAAIIYAVGVSALFGVSATYHRRVWSVTARPRMKRVDHATIFVMIGASYTPLCLLALHGSLGVGILVAVWVSAATGVVFAATGIAEKPVVGLATYIGMGWAVAIMVPELSRRMSTGQLWLIVIGGVLYTVGGIFMGTRWPDPFPTVFGYHELWHLMVVAAVACHYAAILSVVQGAG